MLLLTALLLAGQSQPFLVKPYVQLGDRPRLSAREGMTVLWQGRPGAQWRLEFRQGEGEWREADGLERRPSPVSGRELIQGEIEGLEPGVPIEYRVFHGESQAFRATAKTRKPLNRPLKFVLFGDAGAGSSSQRAIAALSLKQNPDLVLLTGDAVYDRGRAGEYFTRFFPYFEAQMKSVPFVTAPGNHDIWARNLNQYPDGLAYFYHWAFPLNGIPLASGDAGTPKVTVNSSRFRAAAGPRYPRMANFSFDYGDTHWTVLDSNAYTTWKAQEWKNWLRRDLASSTARWKFVVFHHPPYHSSRTHAGDTWMKTIAPILEQAKVAIVFNGHVHNYQRSKPINGVTYIVTGAGGAGLYDRNPASVKPFTARYVGNSHSLTVLEIDGGRLNLRQLATNGKQVDAVAMRR